MAGNFPAAFKPIKAYLLRGEELDKDTSRPETKIVAYHCRKFAMEQALALRSMDSSEEATSFLLNLMSRLEAERETLPPFDGREAQICTDFAYEVFKNADDEDRAGMANKGTARKFYAAKSFFELLKQFGELTSDVQEKITYCKFKATDILAAIKEGRTPTPGGPTEQQAADMGIPPSEFADLSAIGSTLPAPPSNAYAPSPASLSTHSFPSPGVPNPSASMDNNNSFYGSRPASAPPPSQSTFSPSLPQQLPPASVVSRMTQPAPQPAMAQAYGGGGGGLRSQTQMADALELAKFAVAALQSNQADLAVERLQAALQCLR